MVPNAMMRTDMVSDFPPQATTPRPGPRLVRSNQDSTMEFGAGLTRTCADLARKYGRADTIAVTCTTAPGRLPRATAIQLDLIAAELLASAFNAFERNQSGRIAVYYDASESTFRLTVEHSRPTPRAASCHGVAHSWLARTLVARMGGRIEHAVVIGGARTVVTVPLL